MVRQAHHDFISPLYQKIILSLSKDSFGFNLIFELWHLTFIEGGVEISQ
jgi:hypothetical protein